MKQLYLRTFEHVRMSEAHSQALRSELASRCAMKKLEEKNMNDSKKLRRPGLLAVALLVLLALTTTAFAAGGYVVYHIHNGAESVIANGNVQQIDFQPDAILPYEGFTEDNGEVTFSFAPEDWAQTK